ncbi:transposase [Rossellomorea vietnamensis]|uniref:transposase n=1 Tax=Rossellomorea vietnamensis TaxID=218284 RepID=UPI00077CD084|nr:transposase [Rossellomorea vietnamensis]
MSNNKDTSTNRKEVAMYKKREWSPGFIYHITARGNRKYTIFRNKDDRLKYLEIVEAAKEKYPFILHSYCLMTNHVHLLIETQNHPPGKILHYIHYRYARYFNKKNGFNGHLFEGRFKSVLITNNKQLTDTSCYIHLNPVRAGICPAPEGYQWSSYRSFITSRPNKHVETEKILSYMDDGLKSHYKFYVEVKLHQFL